MIRPYTELDKTRLLEIFKLNIPQYFDPKELTDFEEYLNQQSDTYLTIEIKDKIAGGIGYYVQESDQSGRITWVFFDPDYSGKGLGRQAVSHCLTILKSNPKVKKLIVTTSQLAYQFFEKFGYHLVKTEKDYWGKGLDLFLMEQEV